MGGGSRNVHMSVENWFGRFLQRFAEWDIFNVVLDRAKYLDIME